MSERRTKTTSASNSTISNVRVVPVPRVLIPISEIKHMQTMRFITLILTTIGGALTVLYPSLYFLLGILMILVGIVNEYVNVQNVIGKWESYQEREINVNDTVVEASEFE